MNINIYNQLYNLLVFLITGIIIGILFDIFRIFRKSFKTPDFLTYLEDILFWILTGFVLLFSIFVFNSGEIRSYIFVGLGVGIIMYLLTISKYFIKISNQLINILKRIIGYPIQICQNAIKKIIIQPISKILTHISMRIKKVLKILSKKEEINHLPEKCDKIKE